MACVYFLMVPGVLSCATSACCQRRARAWSDSCVCWECWEKAVMLVFLLLLVLMMGPSWCRVGSSVEDLCDVRGRDADSSSRWHAANRGYGADRAAPGSLSSAAGSPLVRDR